MSFLDKFRSDQLAPLLSGLGVGKVPPSVPVDGLLLESFVNPDNDVVKFGGSVAAGSVFFVVHVPMLLLSMPWYSVAGICKPLFRGVLLSFKESLPVQANFLLAATASHLASCFQFPLLGCFLSGAAAVASIVFCWVFAGVIVLVGALALCKCCKFVFSAGACTEWKTGRTSKLLAERRVSFVSPQLVSWFGAAAMELGNWKFLQAAAASRRALVNGFVQGNNGSSIVGSAKGPYPTMSSFCPLDYSADIDGDVLGLWFVQARVALASSSSFAAVFVATLDGLLVSGRCEVGVSLGVCVHALQAKATARWSMRNRIRKLSQFSCAHSWASTVCSRAVLICFFLSWLNWWRPSSPSQAPSSHCLKKARLCKAWDCAGRCARQ